MISGISLFELVGGDFVLAFIAEHQLNGFFAHPRCLEFEHFLGGEGVSFSVDPKKTKNKGDQD
jgi:hypothetical protein